MVTTVVHYHGGALLLVMAIAPTNVCASLIIVVVVSISIIIIITIIIAMTMSVIIIHATTDSDGIVDATIHLR